MFFHASAWLPAVLQAIDDATDDRGAVEGETAEKAGLRRFGLFHAIASCVRLMYKHEDAAGFDRDTRRRLTRLVVLSDKLLGGGAPWMPSPAVTSELRAIAGQLGGRREDEVDAVLLGPARGPAKTLHWDEVCTVEQLRLRLASALRSLELMRIPEWSDMRHRVAEDVLGHVRRILSDLGCTDESLAPPGDGPTPRGAKAVSELLRIYRALCKEYADRRPDRRQGEDKEPAGRESAKARQARVAEYVRALIHNGVWGVDQKRIARDLGIDDSTLSRYFRGDSELGALFEDYKRQSRGKTPPHIDEAW